MPVRRLRSRRIVEPLTPRHLLTQIGIASEPIVTREVKAHVVAMADVDACHRLA